MTAALYRNHAHYIAEGWSREPKESFKALRAIVERHLCLDRLNVLDVGCATGELLGYLAQCMPEGRFVGVDVSDDLLAEARRMVPQAKFVKASALSLPAEFSQRFDVVSAVGCMSIFDEVELETFWDQLLAATRPGGLVIVLSPLNEFGLDMIVRHRKRMEGKLGGWERGWNVFARETIRDLLAARGKEVVFEPFFLPMDLPRKADPIRTWTMRTEENERQLTNGLKLLVDHYFMIVRES